MKRAWNLPRRWLGVAALLSGIFACFEPCVRGQQPQLMPGPATPPAAPGNATTSDTSTTPYFNVTGNDDQLKMVVNTSRFLRLNKKIPQVQVNNPDILSIVPVSPTEVQISAKRTGVTQVNLWGDDKRIYTVNVLVIGDAGELTQVLRALFPRATLKITPINASSVVISGYVEEQLNVPKIVAVASKYYPDVINNMMVSGTQQGVVHVKVVEVSRTKLRRLGVDWALSGPNYEVFSGVNGLLSTTSVNPLELAGPDKSFKFSVAGANAFASVVDALREDSVAKILSEPNIVAISGRPAYVMVGGKYYYQITSAQGVASSDHVDYGTRLDIVPIILGNGRMHIDVRATVSQIDITTTVAGAPPSLKSREAETGVELRSGQTLAIAGLIEQRSEAMSHGLPWLSEVPYIGVLFGSKSYETNEVELIVLLTPELVDGMEPGQVPACLPGMNTTEPSDWELFFKGHLEVPVCCPAEGGTCPPGNSPSGEPTPSPEAAPQDPHTPTTTHRIAANPPPPEPSFIGPIGYDILK